MAYEELVNQFADTLRSYPLMKPQARPDPSWRVFKTWKQADQAVWSLLGPSERTQAFKEFSERARRTAEWYSGSGITCELDGRDAARKIMTGWNQSFTEADAEAGRVLYEAGCSVRAIMNEVTEAVSGVRQLGWAAYDPSKGYWDNDRCFASSDLSRGVFDDATLMVRAGVASRFGLDQRYLDHARARMQVWWRGYGLLCDYNGVFYVYRKLHGHLLG